MAYECECGPEPALLPLQEPWEPGNGYKECEEGANVWCAACCDAWKVSPQKLAEVTSAARQWDAEQADRAEAMQTARELADWEEWAAQHTTKSDS